MDHNVSFCSVTSVKVASKIWARIHGIGKPRFQCSARDLLLAKVQCGILNVEVEAKILALVKLCKNDAKSTSRCASQNV